MKLAFIICGLILAACSQPTPLSASASCGSQRATFEQYASCVRTALGDGTSTPAQAYRTFLAYTEGEVRSGRATDAQAFYTDQQLMQLVAANQAQREADLSDRRAAAMQHMGDQLIQMGAPQQLSPPLICNHYTAQTICH
ncbi:MAG: hypothetical protein ACRC67_16810 [Inquilinus sp.]|uniref:hypothetical protein n=1 Tax=Inquilinus sp. TaxID=1932117 RepID=UPI003F34BAD9